jgi:hypothetical protein
MALCIFKNLHVIFLIGKWGYKFIGHRNLRGDVAQVMHMAL